MAVHHDIRHIAMLAGTMIAWCLAAPVMAQTASQITPQTFEPQRQVQGGGVVIPEGAGQAAPAGAEKLDVLIGGVQIAGGLPALAEASAKIEAELTGKRITAAGLFEAASRLQAAYVAEGYALVRVLLPAQRINDGATLRITVIDGFLERVDTAQLPDNIRSRVADVLAPLVRRTGITNAVIERQVLLAGDMPGSVLRSTLSPGSVPGGVVLTMEARYKPVTGSISTDNRLADPLGKYNTAVGLDFNSTFGLGELIYLRASGAPRLGADGGFFTDTPRNRALAGGITLPFGNDGLTLNLEGTIARTAPEVVPGGLAFLSDFSRYSARLNFPVIRSRNLTVNLNAAFDAQQEEVKAINLGGLGLSEDRLRVVRAGADLSWYLSDDILLTAAVTGSLGINGLGARSAADAALSLTPLSRQGADAAFQKLEINLGYRQTMAEHLVFDLRAKAQTSFGQPLLNAEQIGLASTNGLSSFASGLMQGDDGFVVRGEAQFPFTLPFELPFGLPAIPPQQGTGLPADDASRGALVLSPYLFGAYGVVGLQKPTAVEAAWTQGASYGVGLRLGAAEQSSFNAINLNLEYGRTERFGNGPNADRFTLSAALQF